MELFSERQGIKPKRNVIQIESVDESLSNSLWNALTISCWNKAKPNHSLKSHYNSEILRLCQILWIYYFKLPLDTLGNDWEFIYKKLRAHFFGCEWYKIYDFIEFIAANLEYEGDKKRFVDDCNHFLELEHSGYRFVSGKITQITSEEEIAEIEQAIDVSITLKPVNEHLQRALDLLADRKQPDYRNSIKEAILAVEALCRLITGDDKATLGQALKRIEKQAKVELHPALGEAFVKLYGYTSDEEGIRHSLMAKPNLEFEDAKFMLVSCSAFTNYLIVKSSKAGISL